MTPALARTGPGMGRDSKSRIRLMIVDVVEDVVEALSDPTPVRAAMGAGWERASKGMVETEEGPLLLVDIDALIAGTSAETRAA